MGPPPAVGAGRPSLAATCAAHVRRCRLRRAKGGTFDGVFIRAGSGISRARGVGPGGVAIGGVVGCTTPICRAPGGAAIRLTRYVGAIGKCDDGRANNSTAAAAAWSATDTTSGARSENSVVRRHGAHSHRLRIGHEPHVAHAGGAHDREHLRHDAVRNVRVAAQIHAVARPLRRERTERRAKFRERHLRLVHVHRARAIDRHDQPALRLQRLRLRLRQRDVHAALHHRRGDHEDDEQQQHHVDEADDVDLRVERHPLAPAAAPR